MSAKRPIFNLRELDDVVALAIGSGEIVYFVNASTLAKATITSAALALLDDADSAAMRTTLQVVPGTHVQAYHALLAAIAGTTPTSGNVLSGNGTAYASISPDTAGLLTKDGTSQTKTGLLTLTGGLSVPGSGSNSFAIGSGASCANSNSGVLGTSSTISGGGGTAVIVGVSSTITSNGHSNVIVGSSSAITNVGSK